MFKIDIRYKNGRREQVFLSAESTFKVPEPGCLVAYDEIVPPTRTEQAQIGRLVYQGHDKQCAYRQVIGDGECQCKGKKS